jgi:DNA-binding CsgD family transcriptional regulator
MPVGMAMEISTQLVSIARQMVVFALQFHDIGRGAAREYVRSDRSAPDVSQNWRQCAMMTKPPIPPDIKAFETRLASLTVRQRQCLALVAQGYSSKEVATRLGNSSGRVDKHIYEARGKLGGIARQEAARLVAAYEADRTETSQGAQKIGAQSLGLPFPAASGQSESTDAQVDADIADVGLLAAQQEGYHGSVRFLFMGNLLPFRTSGRPDNDLNSNMTLIALAIMAALALVMAGSAASLLSALDALVRH